MTTPWIVATDGTNPAFPFGFACLRCGQKKAIPEKLPVTRYLARAKIFRKVHERCEERREER